MCLCTHILRATLSTLCARSQACVSAVLFQRAVTQTPNPCQAPFPQLALPSPALQTITPHHHLQAANYSGEQPLALPKLNLQFLSPSDYLLRNFHLFRLEAAYEVREDIQVRLCDYTIIYICVLACWCQKQQKREILCGVKGEGKSGCVMCARQVLADRANMSTPRSPSCV